MKVLISILTLSAMVMLAGTSAWAQSKDNSLLLKVAPGSGFVAQGSKLVAQPGFHFNMKGSNAVTAMRIGGGGLGASLECVCIGRHGLCDASASDDVAVCSKSPTEPCTGNCRWSTKSSTNLGGGGKVAQ